VEFEGILDKVDHNFPDTGMIDVHVRKIGTRNRGLANTSR
jgi:hypothetical protein